MTRRGMGVCKDCGTLCDWSAKRCRVCFMLALWDGKTGQGKHGHTIGRQASPTFQSWKAMIQRCSNPANAKFKFYGGRGVKICDRWRDSFESFLADMGERPEGKTLDRWPNNAGDYEPGNCRWATKAEQTANQRRR